MSGTISPLTVYTFMKWAQSTLRSKVIMKITYQLCLRTVQVVSSLKVANVFVFSIKQSKEMTTNCHVAGDLNLQHHRVRRSNLPALHQFEHYMCCHRYPVCGTEQSVALCCCLNCLSCGLSFCTDSLVLPL